MPFINAARDRNRAGGVFAKHSIRLELPATREITAFAQGRHITPNTLMQATWAFLLYSYTGSNDILCGVTE